MTDQNRKCIYCPQQDASRFRGVEHVIPQSFGTFGGETPTLDCVCDDCNAYFGRELDQLLARDTLEGVSRYNRGQFSSEARPQKRLSITLADQKEAGAFAGLKVAVDGTTGKLMRPLAQFHVFNFSTGKTEIYFQHQLAGLKLPEAIYGRPGKDGEKGTWQAKAFAPSKEEHDALVEALVANGIDYRSGTPFQPPPAMGDEQGEPPAFLVEIAGEVDTQHKRAIAKILMNFVAKYLGRDEALKPRWDFVRNYVRKGEGKIKARLTDRPFWTGQETDMRRFQDDSINVQIENFEGHIIGVIQFYNRFSYGMILVENDALPASAEIGYRFTPGNAPIRGEKRQLHGSGLS